MLVYEGKYSSEGKAFCNGENKLSSPNNVTSSYAHFWELDRSGF